MKVDAVIARERGIQVEFLTADGVQRAIERLIVDYDELHWAVAWGTSTPLAKKLLSHAPKFRAVTFGLAFAQTDPHLVDSLVELDGCYVVTKFPEGTYHPKIYAFRSGERAAAIVGSANFTWGGLGKNHEASVLITGSIHDRALADIFAYVKQSAKLGKRVSAELAHRYRISCKRAARMARPPRDPLLESPKDLLSPLVGMDWGQYVRAVRADRGPAHHDVARSLGLLRTAQAWLSAAPSFGDLTTPQRKAIAGVIGVRDKAGDDKLGQDWGWFGSMRGAGDFMNRIAENDRSLASAVDSIPQKGEITKDDFDRFAELFEKAFVNSDRVGGVPTASRLLAMKRPDVFLCISKPNLTAAAKEMEFAKSTLRLDNYWDRVVEVIRASDWYNTDKPVREGQLWECRAAMLDVILYAPH